MMIQTRTLGAVDATPESFVTLPEGLIGYDDQREFALVASTDHAPFRWLLSFADPDVTFPLLPAQLVADDYRPGLAASDARAIGAVGSDALEIYVIAAVDAEGRLTVEPARADRAQSAVAPGPPGRAVGRALDGRSPGRTRKRSLAGSLGRTDAPGCLIAPSRASHTPHHAPRRGRDPCWCWDVARARTSGSATTSR